MSPTNGARLSTAPTQRHLWTRQNDAIIGKNLEGVVTSWNPGATRLYGYSAAEIIGQPISVLIPADHTDEESELLRRL